MVVLEIVRWSDQRGVQIPDMVASGRAVPFRMSMTHESYPYYYAFGFWRVHCTFNSSIFQVTNSSYIRETVHSNNFFNISGLLSREQSINHVFRNYHMGSVGPLRVF